MTVRSSEKPIGPKQEAWGPKLRVKITHSKSLDDPRPLTATLERPVVLDIALLKKLDMTTFTKKGLLTVMNMCGVSIVKKRERKKKDVAFVKLKKGKRRLKEKSKSLDSEKSKSMDSESEGPKTLRAVRRKTGDDESSWTDVNSGSELKTQRSELKPQRPERGNRKLGAVKPDRYLTNKQLGRNRAILKISDSIDEVFGGPVRTSVPEPCRTCGRSNHPERLHSHPKPPAMEVKIRPVKAAIAKPVPAKFRSAEKAKKGAGLVVAPPTSASAVTVLPPPLPLRAGKPRTITCYLCAREFGTASFPLHEPKCIQKWERENARLPVALQRQLPERPAGQISIEDWNQYAWKVSQMSLVPCEKCGRTFNPDRIQVHQRACKGEGGRQGTEVDSTSSSPSPVPRPRTVVCYICGREFGSKSISIHEPQCLKKWNLANEQLPVGKRRPEPIRPASGGPDNMATFHSIWNNHMDSLIPCKSCGRKFFPDRIERHEECCSIQPVKTNKK